MIPKLEYIPVEDFMHMANIIAGCRFFIGNQSFPFAIAEALKVKRLLEVYHLSPMLLLKMKMDMIFAIRFSLKN